MSADLTAGVDPASFRHSVPLNKTQDSIALSLSPSVQRNILPLLRVAERTGRASREYRDGGSIKLDRCALSLAAGHKGDGTDRSQMAAFLLWKSPPP